VFARNRFGDNKGPRLAEVRVSGSKFVSLKKDKKEEEQKEKKEEEITEKPKEKGKLVKLHTYPRNLHFDLI